MFSFFPHIRTNIEPKKVQVSVTLEERLGEHEADKSCAAWPSLEGFSIKEAAQLLPPPAGPGRWVRGPQNPQLQTELCLWCGSVIVFFGFGVSLSYAGCSLSSPSPLSLAHFSMSRPCSPPSQSGLTHPPSFPPAGVIRLRGQGRVSP